MNGKRSLVRFRRICRRICRRIKKAYNSFMRVWGTLLVVITFVRMCCKDWGTSELDAVLFVFTVFWGLHVIVKANDFIARHDKGASFTRHRW